MKHIVLLLFSFLLVLSACSTTETASEPDPDRPLFELDDEEAEEIMRSELDEFERLLYDSRSRLTDQFASIKQKIPETFLKEIVEEETKVDEYAGYRIQILHTRDVAEADSTIDDFRVWASGQFEDTEINAYVHFRQPYYRVRAGNFRDRSAANYFARLLKDRYPDAWVVHDRIDPNRVIQREDLNVNTP